MPTTNPDISELWLTVYLLEAGGLVLLAGVLLALFRTHRRAFLQAWSLAWAILALERASTVALAATGLFDSPWSWRATTGLAMGHVALLFAGAWFLVRDTGWSRRSVALIGGLPFVVATALCAWAGDLPPGERWLGLEAAVRLITGGGLIASAAAVVLGTRPIRTVGRRSTAALLFLTGALQAATAGLIWRQVHAPAIGSMLELVVPQIFGLVLEGLLTLGMVLWFYENDRRRLTETTAALAEAEAQRRHAQHMESLGRLAGGVAHDFNNLLTAISGHVELLLHRKPEGHPDRDDLVPVARATRRATRLVGELLAFARRQPRSPRPVRLHALLRENECSIQRLVGAGVELAVRPCTGDPVVEADPTQIVLTLLNLAANARDAMRRSGTLRITTTLCTLAEGEDAVLAAGGYVRMDVADTGCGIPGENHERVFEPFFTTKADQGTGLGLSSVYGIVRQCGGDVRLASAPGQGACFSLWFPLSDREPEPEEELRPFVPRGAARRGATILLVEDDLGVRSLTQRLLTRAGHRVHAVPDAASALEILGTETIDLLFSDVHLRGGRGDDLALQARREHPDLRVILTSGAASLGHDLGDLDEDVRLLAKPFGNRELLEAVRNALDGPRRGVAGGLDEVGGAARRG